MGNEHRQKKKLKVTLETHDTRLSELEDTLHKERLSKWAVRGIVGLTALLLGWFYDPLAAFCIKTRYLSIVSYAEGIGIVQGLLIVTGVLLLFYSARKFEIERRAE